MDVHADLDLYWTATEAHCINGLIREIYESIFFYFQVIQSNPGK